MATKTITFKGGQLVDTTEEIVGWVADDSSGLSFVADPGTGDAQVAYSSLTHMATETSNPLWNQVKYHGTFNTTASALYDGHVTLQGIKPDGTFNDIMEKRENTTATAWTGDNTFDLLGSNCTNDLYNQVADGATSAGTIDVNLPLRYGKYEDVDIVGAWFDEAWQYRIALTLERTNYQLHGAEGHSSDFYGNTIYVPYKANMSSTTQDDVRFTGPDGVTELPFYQLSVVDSSYAVYLVMVPWAFMDKEAESYPYNVTGYAFKKPQYIHCYYGNATATSASDVTLGGNALFYDDFSSDLGWTFGGAADTTESIANGYLELRSTASKDSQAFANRDMDFSGSDATSWEVVVKIIYDTPVYTNTTTSNGPYVRIRGQGAEDTSYWELKHFYIAAGAGESAANVAGHMWGRASSDSGSATSTAYANNIVSAVGDNQYVKFRWNKRDATGGGTNYMQFFQSDDGVNWNSIGDLSGITSVFDTIVDLNMALYYVGKSGVAADKYIRFDSIIAYPIMTGTTQHIAWEESFQNGTLLDRYGRLNYSAGTRFQTETQDLIKFENTSGTYCRWDNTYKEALCLYLGGGITTPTTSQTDVLIYECTVAGLAENATAGVVADAGMAMSDRAGTSSADTSAFHLRWTATGATRTFYRQIFVAGTSSAADTLTGTWAQADFPIGLRMIFNARDKILYYQYRKYGSNGEWFTCGTSPTGFTLAISGGYIIPMLFWKQATSNSGNCTFNNWRWSNGGGVVDSYGKSGPVGTGTSTWFPEEDYSADYPLAISGSPTEDDMTVTFTCPTPNKRGNPMKLRTKDFGGDYNYSKTFYLTDKDEINVGPAGTDQYMGLRLVFDFKFGATDEISFDKVEFIYEVI